ncbi:phytoene/squalene synthetase [Rubidibacter lacunae KORDI 51-2]|uniref:Phytoene/squalene synthetase n=1 Tax=Rubidibacter lacunae KORDI 51-2 TaxID=582515 RepID=U5DQ04_9CHRO|nr:phytoene/squalene synthase family protein [Rubidibacter lacunae]ERN41780.1 phytoene/squalene synthetase [Rubidibacter lacunae KORDI 51-2]
MSLLRNAIDMLQATSRTFLIPISGLPPRLKEAVTSAYLCMRAIDEIEDHPHLDNVLKAKLLRSLSLNLQSANASTAIDDFTIGLESFRDRLDSVTMRVGEWALLAPDEIAPRVWDASAAMADRMAYWAECNWLVRSQADLDCYTFSVAGAVGLLLSDLWGWYDNTQTDRMHAIGFGRGLQAVNILRNRSEDLGRGADFLPEGWSTADLHDYARYNLSLADQYCASLPHGPALNFCRIPLALAYGTLDALSQGKEKLSRSDVLALVAMATSSN